MSRRYVLNSSMCLFAALTMLCRSIFTPLCTAVGGGSDSPPICLRKAYERSIIGFRFDALCLQFDDDWKVIRPKRCYRGPGGALMMLVNGRALTPRVEGCGPMGLFKQPSLQIQNTRY